MKNMINKAIKKAKEIEKHENLRFNKSKENAAKTHLELEVENLQQKIMIQELLAQLNELKGAINED